MKTVATSSCSVTTRRCPRSASRIRSTAAPSSGTPSSAAWNARAPSRSVAYRSCCFEPVSEYSDPFRTPSACASASIDVPWYPRSANRRAASRVNSSLRVAITLDANDRSVGRRLDGRANAGVPRLRPVRRTGGGDRLDARRVPLAARQVHRDARQLRAHGRAPRARLDPPRADAAAEARSDGEDPGRGRPRAADLPSGRGPGQAAHGVPRRPRLGQGEVPQRLPLPDEDLG